MNWDKRQDEVEPKWSHFIFIMAFSAVIFILSTPVLLGRAALSKVRSWA